MAALNDDYFDALNDDESDSVISDETQYIPAVGFGQNHLNINNNNNNNNPTENEIALWDTFPRIEQPTDLAIKLFPHQLVTVYKMEKLEHERKVIIDSNTHYMTDFGILGDIPGYGKSFSIVALILRDKMPWDINSQNIRVDVCTYNMCLKKVTKSVKKRIRPNLILCSPTLVEQWKEYFDFVKKDLLNIVEISQKKDIPHTEDGKEKFKNADVVICSSTRYNDLVSIMGPVVWRRFIFDEAGSTHIPSMRTVQAGFVWFVSATYTQMFRTIGTGHHYMRHFFDHIDYVTIEHFVVKNPSNFVRHSFKMPEVYHKTYLCVNPRMLNILSTYIDEESKLMISAGDIRGALQRLGGGLSTTDTNLFEIVAKRQQEKLNDALYHVQFWKNRGSHPSFTKELETWEKRVESIKKNLEELQEKYKNVLKDDCTICYSEIDKPVLLSCCQNVFCGSCIMKWMETKKTCPMCRASLNVKEIVYIDIGGSLDNEKEKEKEKKVETKAKTKQQTVLDIVSQEKDEKGNRKKYLIFSMYDESFSTIRRELEANRMNYVEISGSKATRDSKLKRFKEGKVDIVFLNSRFNGAGINLQMTTDIVMYHEMPQNIEEQVIGRALRIGREGDLTIHHLCFPH